MLCIGVGNIYRGDDGVGPYVAQRLQNLQLPGLVACEASGEGTDLISRWSDFRCVAVVDAVISGAEPGALIELDVRAQPILSSMFATSTHAFGVAEAVEMARILGQLPEYLRIYGIEGASFEHGCGLTQIVEETADQVVQRIAAEVERLEARGGAD
ncbi:MAG: hydrogenase maturation protease [Anaerolineae bacterium]|nr:hydrogenase maturation protease [Anaerolineae bacterium]